MENFITCPAVISHLCRLRVRSEKDTRTEDNVGEPLDTDSGGHRDRISIFPSLTLDLTLRAQQFLSPLFRNSLVIHEVRRCLNSLSE